MSTSFRGHGSPTVGDVGTADPRRGPDAARRSSRRRSSGEKLSANQARAAAGDTSKSTGSLPALPVRSPLKGQLSPSGLKRGGGFGGLQGTRLETEAQVEFISNKLKQAQGIIAQKNQHVVSELAGKHCSKQSNWPATFFT